MFLFLESAKGVDATTITGTGTSYDPYRDTIDIGADEVDTYFQQYYGINRRVMGGTEFNITKYTSGSIEIAVTSISTGSGLTLSNGSLTGHLTTSPILVTFTVESDDGIHTTSNTYSILPVRYKVTFVGSPNGAGGANESALYVPQFTQYYAGSLSNSIEFYTGEVIVPSANPGYEFDHWSSTSGYVTSDMTITAYFNALADPVVNFVSNPSGLNMGLSNITVPVGTTATTSGRTITFSDGHTITAPETIGNYAFSYWYPAGTGGSGITSDKTFTAYYVNYNYSLSFDGNGNTGGTVPSTMTSGPTSSSSYSFIIPNSVPTKTGYRFTGWSYYTTDVTGQYQPGETVTLYSSNQTRTLHAIWSNQIYKYQLSLNYGDPDSHTSYMYYPSDNTQWTSESSYIFTLPSISSSYYPAHTFIGWAETVEGPMTLVPGSSYKLDGQANTTAWKPLYGRWVEGPYDYSLNFDPNGGTGVSEQTLGPVTAVSELSYTFVIDNTIVAPTPSDPSLHFLGWTTTDDYDGTTPLYNEGDTFTVQVSDPMVVEQSFTLYAVFALWYTYELEYDLDGGSWNEPSDTEHVENGFSSHDFVVRYTTPTLAGHKFLGWAFPPHTTATIFGGDTIHLDGVAGDTVSTTLIAIWYEYDDSVTYWSNDEYNGSVSVLYKLDDPGNRTYYLNNSAMLYNFAGKGPDGKTAIFSVNGYTLTAEITSQPLGSGNWETIITATLKDNNNVVVITNTENIGRWDGFIVTMSPLDYTVKLTKVSKFLNFTSYTENDTVTILDFSNAELRARVFTTPISLYDMSFYYLGNAPRQQVVNTKVFMETYGVVMTDPIFDIDQYWPNREDIRMNLFSFAIYGNAMTINGETFRVVDQKVTISYIGGMNPYKLPGYDTPSQDIRTRTFSLTNLSIMWNEGHCYLTFEGDMFTLDLGEYTNRVISFGGNWYFSSGVYEVYTVQETEITKDWWHFSFDFQAFALILAGLLTLAGVVMRLKTKAKGFDYLIIVGGIVIALILAGGIIR